MPTVPLELQARPLPAWLDMVRGLAVIGGFTAAGFGIVLLTRWPFPPPLIGLVLFWLALARGWVPRVWVARAGSLLLRNMSLFFLPILLGAPRGLEFSARNCALYAVLIFGGTLLNLWVTQAAASRLLQPAHAAAQGAPQATAPTGSNDAHTGEERRP